MKVAYLINRYPALSHTFVRREIAAVERLGIEVTRYSIRKSPPSVDPADSVEAGRTVVVLSRSNVMAMVVAVVGSLLSPLTLCRAFGMAVRMAIGTGGARAWIAHTAYLVEACWLKHDMGQRGIEHLHAHFGTNPAAVAMLCRLLGGPTYSFTVHGPDEFDAPTGLSLGEKVQNAAAVMAISSYGRSQILRWIPVESWPKVRVIRCGLDDDYLQYECTAVSSRAKLVTVGRLSRQKGYPVLLKALAIVQRECAEVELAVIGEGEERLLLQRMSAELKIEPHIRFLGARDATFIRTEMQDAKAFVLSSFAEGLPVVIMEAFALGRPVIATSVAGVPELVRPGVNGWLVPAGDEHALADAMLAAIRLTPSEASRLGGKGRERVQEQHNVSRIAPDLVQIFREVGGR